MFLSGQKVLITEDLEDVTVLEGESAMFKCRISPVDYSKVQWFLDKTPLHTNELNDIQSQPGGCHLLTLKKLSLKDSGVITFEAGDKKTSASLIVKGNSIIKTAGEERMGRNRHGLRWVGEKKNKKIYRFSHIICILYMFKNSITYIMKLQLPKSGFGLLIDWTFVNLKALSQGG